MFLAKSGQKYPEISESIRWKMCNDLADIAYSMLLDQNKGMSEQYQKLVGEYEQHRNQFREHIDFLHKSSKTLIHNLKHGTFVKIEHDRVTRQPYLMGKTKVVDEMVEYLNQVDKRIGEFYKEVYKIEETGTNNAQTTLFS